MKRLRASNQSDDPRTLMVWSITDAVIENRDILERQFDDLVKAGFGGVAVFVRCSRYSWDDPLAMQTLRSVGALCRRNRMRYWIGPDPRFVSHRIVRDGSGLELVLFGDTSKAGKVPNTAPVQSGRYSIRCLLPPRHVHTLTDVAVEFVPVGIARVYAIRNGGKPLGRRDVIDITADARMFYNARDRYVEAFGRVPERIKDTWSVVAFFHVRTNHFDFSDRAHLQRYAGMLRVLKAQGCRPDGVMWDEPGYTCQYGSLPYTPAVRKMYRTARSSDLDGELWKLAFEAEDSSHIPVRLAYYRSVQGSITRAESNLRSTALRLWGPATMVGIHDTWHFESADMCDMNHGSMDLWATTKAKTGGFVDLGGVNQLKDPSSPWYANLAAMSVVAASLGKSSAHPVVYNNLWTVGDDNGKGWQHEVMDHCVNVMGLFGTRWLAHAYGPAGTIGQERSFLGTPELPGYPHHSTWASFPVWNRRLPEHLDLIGNRLPEANILVLYPVESLYGLADQRANGVAGDVFNLILSLLDEHFHVDVLSTPIARRGSWRKEQFHVGWGAYDVVICPHASVMNRALFKRLTKRKERVLFTHTEPAWFEDGKHIRPVPATIPTTTGLVSRLKAHPGLRPVHAPDRSWVTMVTGKKGIMVSLAPSRAGYEFEGTVSLGNRSITLQRSSQLTRILFPSEGEPLVL